MLKRISSIIVLTLLLAPARVQAQVDGLSVLPHLDLPFARVALPGFPADDRVPEALEPATDVSDVPVMRPFVEGLMDEIGDAATVANESEEQEEDGGEEDEEEAASSDDTAEESTESAVAQPGGGIVAETALGDPVLYWNGIALQALLNDHTGTFGPPQQFGPGPASRALAIMHAAIFDAVNSITKTHEPYLTMVPIRSNAAMQPSVDAAVATAAHMTLVTLYPAQRIFLRDALRTHLDAILRGKDMMMGMNVGRIVAAQMLNARRRDGAEKDASMPYTSSDLPGRHRPDPTNPQQAIWGPGWGNVKPFVVESSTQFRAPPPPAITSEEYAEAYEEVKNYGGDGVTTPMHRSEDQTAMGIFWAYDGTRGLGPPPRIYNQIARMIAEQMGNTVVENARLFALLNLAQADAGIGCWESKYVYDYWRPIVAIREADEGTGPTGLGDDNPLTAGDPTWTPLGAPASNQSNNGRNFTPPFPAYPSGHATFGAASFGILEHFYATDDMPFTFTSDEMNGVTTDNVGTVRPVAPRAFGKFSDAAWENALSRIYLGIHWRFDASAGIAMGTSIADYVFGNVLRPIGN
jgi:hypothetical protein